MKFFILASALLFLPAQQQDNNCGEARVPNSLQFCIRPNQIEGCDSYETEDRCASCQAGYNTNKSGGCDALEFQQRLQKLPGCLARDLKNPQKCINCADGYVRNEGRCLLGVKHCQKYERNQCLKCERCKKVGGSRTCLECDHPFVLKGESCSVENCKTLNDYGCVTCQCGYYLQADRTCKKIQEGCLRYQRGRCIDCLNHYRLKGGVCEIEGCIKYKQHYCIECKPEYVNVKGGCAFRDCVDWSNDQCLSCQQGFRNEGGVCKQEKQQNCPA